MKKTGRILLLVVLVQILLSGCGTLPVKYHLEKDTSSISRIEIVNVPDADEVYLSNYDNIAVIATVNKTEWEKFWSDFNQIPRFRVLQDPMEYIEGYAIRITYDSGELELIGQYSALYDDGKYELSRRYKWAGFDENAFAEFISVYLN